MVTNSCVLAAWRVLTLATWALAAAATYRARPPTKVELSTLAPKSVSEPVFALPSTSTIETVTALGERHDAAALGALIAIADHGAPRVVDAALDGISAIGGKSARSYLAQRLSDAPDAELSSVAQALARSSGIEAHDILFRAASSARPTLRAEARAAIALLDTADARGFMLEELNSEEPLVAVNYFADCVDARAVPGLERIARGAQRDVRRSAIGALFAQGESSHAAIGRLLDADGELADAVLEASVPTAETHRLLLAASIARLRRGALSAGPVFDFLAHDFSSEGLNALTEAAHDEATASSAITALQTRGDAAALSVLARLTNDASQTVATNATCALVAGPDSRSRPYLARASEHMTLAITTALVEIDAPEAASFLARLRVSPNEDEREAALRLSDQVGSPRIRRIRIQ